MPEEESSGIKLKIFLAALLIFLVFMVGFYAYNYINLNHKYINEESKTSTDCIYQSFQIIRTEYKNNSLFLLLKNPATSSSKINRINIMIKNTTLSKEANLDLQMQKEILFENITIEDDTIKVYPDNCEAYSKTVVIEKKGG